MSEEILVTKDSKFITNDLAQRFLARIWLQGQAYSFTPGFHAVGADSAIAAVTSLAACTLVPRHIVEEEIRVLTGKADESLMSRWDFCGKMAAEYIAENPAVWERK